MCFSKFSLHLVGSILSASGIIGAVTQVSNLMKLMIFKDELKCHINDNNGRSEIIWKEYFENLLNVEDEMEAVTSTVGNSDAQPLN